MTQSKDDKKNILSKMGSGQSQSIKDEKKVKDKTENKNTTTSETSNEDDCILGKPDNSSKACKNVDEVVVKADEKCTLKLQNYENKNYKVSLNAGDRYLDKGDKERDSDGNLTYENQLIDYGSSKGNFDIIYIEAEKKIIACLKVRLVPFEIKLKHNETKKFKTLEDDSTIEKIVPYIWNKTSHNAEYDKEYRFYYEFRKLSSENNFAKKAKGDAERILNAKSFFLKPKSCDKDETTCIYKIKIEFVVDFVVENEQKGAEEWRDKRKSKKGFHQTLNLFPKAERADSGNLGEKVRDRTIAHEMGHLLGFPDEYYLNGGAVHKMYIKGKKIDEKMLEPDNDWKRYSRNGLMGSGFDVYAYYMHHINEWFNKKTNKEWSVTE